LTFTSSNKSSLKKKTRHTHKHTYSQQRGTRNDVSSLLPLFSFTLPVRFFSLAPRLAVLKLFSKILRWIPVFVLVYSQHIPLYICLRYASPMSIPPLLCTTISLSWLYTYFVPYGLYISLPGPQSYRDTHPYIYTHKQHRKLYNPGTNTHTRHMQFFLLLSHSSFCLSLATLLSLLFHEPQSPIMHTSIHSNTHTTLPPSKYTLHTHTHTSNIILSIVPQGYTT
jgi:hypothetical protein